jgi:hypothetical protein
MDILDSNYSRLYNKRRSYVTLLFKESANYSPMSMLTIFVNILNVLGYRHGNTEASRFNNMSSPPRVKLTPRGKVVP